MSRAFEPTDPYPADPIPGRSHLARRPECANAPTRDRIVNGFRPRSADTLYPLVPQTAALGTVTLALSPGETAESLATRLERLTELSRDRISLTSDSKQSEHTATAGVSASPAGGAPPDTGLAAELAAALASSGGGKLMLHVAQPQLSSLVVALPAALAKRLGRRLALAVSAADTVDSLKDKVRLHGRLRGRLHGRLHGPTVADLPPAPAPSIAALRRAVIML